MAKTEYLIDTNVIIDYLGQKLPEPGMVHMNNVIDDIPCISIITKIEVLGFSAPEKHEQLLLSFMNDAIIFELSQPIVDICIEIRKKYKTKLPDAIIAATSLAFDFTLITRNVSDFKKIEGLKIFNPYDL